MPKSTRQQPRVKVKSPVVADPPPTQTAVPLGEEVGVEMSLAEFCGLGDFEMRLIDLKICLAREVKARRTASKLTQAALADRLGVAKARIAELESSRPGTSLDALMAAFFAVGGCGADLAAIGAEVDSLVGR